MPGKQVLERKSKGKERLRLPTPPPRLPASSVGTGDLDRGIGIADRGPNPRIDRGLRVEVPIDSWAGAANRGPRPFHRGHRRPSWVPAASVEGLGRRLAAPASKSIGNSNSKPPVDSGVGAANWLPQLLHRGRQYPWRP
ncbi:hypothetical protein CRG98_021234 [Punica granatum]|uniref:Uncharacterized protein n=1 Tax=Punica granatum TaxID=22663 RepID=A0A2I0JPY0_PUNGR|nr:hypothetical protein CRG98_021234 [Punica granatum]